MGSHIKAAVLRRRDEPLAIEAIELPDLVHGHILVLP